MNLNFDTKLTTQNHKIDVSLSESNQTIGSAFSDVVQVQSGGTVTSVSVQMNGEIKGTVEDQWYKKANEDNNFIEINEEELELVLKGELDKKAKTQQKINNEILRY